MTVLSVSSARSYAAHAGFIEPGLSTIVAIAQAESGLATDARNVNNDGSIDRGVLQINNKWHPEVSDAQAYAPQSAFQAGYRISSRGTDFTPWTTYTTGAYKQFLNVNTSTTSTQTVAQIFQAKNLVQWWNNPTQTFGQNGEMGCDYGMGNFGVPVGAIAAGTVIYVGDGGYPGSSIGSVVQIALPDGSLTHYQHLMSTNLKVGNTVAVADTVGLGGGCPAGSYGTNPACTVYDQFSTGQHIEVRFANSYTKSGMPWSNAGWVNPQQIFLRMASAPPNSNIPSNGNTTTGTNFFTALVLPKVHLTPTADVTSALYALDQVLTIGNPFNFTPQQDTILGVTFSDPIAWIDDVSQNLMADLTAIILRFIIILAGVIICYKVINHFINLGAIAKTGTQFTMDLARLGIMFA